MTHQTFHRKLYEHVEEMIGLRIIKGEYKPGDTLPNEDKLCAEFNVSRGVIREAFKVLQKKGLVWPRPKIGTQIQPKSKWNLFDADILVWKLGTDQPFEFLKKVTEVRSIIESEAARLAAKRATPDEIDEIKRHWQRLETILENEAAFDYENYLQTDMAFHLSILESAHNEVLAQIGRTMRHAVQSARQADIKDMNALLVSHTFHSAIVSAIENSDPDGAYSASQAMFDQLGDNIPDRTVNPHRNS